MKLILSSLLLLSIAATIVGLSSAATVTQSITGSGISCSNSCVNGVCESTCSDSSNMKSGSGEIVYKEVKLKGFNTITVDTINVIVEQGDSYLVSLKADSNLIDDIVVEKKGDDLEVRRKDGSYQNDTMEVRIVLPNLKSFSNIGAMEASIVELEQSNISIINEGAGIIVLRNSKFGSLNYTAIGSTRLEASSTEVDAAHLDLEGVSDVNIAFSANAGKLTGVMEGISSVFYCGKPEIDVERSDIVTIEQVDCP